MSETGDDFERICHAAMAHFGDGDLPHVPLQMRRGMLAALKAMREPAFAMVRMGLVEDPKASGDDIREQAEADRELWQAMIDELIRQGEGQGAGE